MPKPVLSDSLFNADDVATAVLAEANLQVTNNDLGVSDITDQFTVNSNWLTGGTYPNKLIAYHFNGFVFFGLHIYKQNATPTTGEVIVTIDNADYRPGTTFSAPTVSHEGDTAMHVQILTNGDITINYAVNAGGSNFSVLVNCFWRT